MTVLSISVAYTEQLSSSGLLRQQRIISRCLFSLRRNIFSVVSEHTVAVAMTHAIGGEASSCEFSEVHLLSVRQIGELTAYVRGQNNVI